MRKAALGRSSLAPKKKTNKKTLVFANLHNEDNILLLLIISDVAAESEICQKVKNFFDITKSVCKDLFLAEQWLDTVKSHTLIIHTYTPH